MGEQRDKDQTWLLSADSPIRGRSDDAFGRAVFADALARQLSELDGNESYVLGLQGPWGAGKTSVLNMVAESLAQSGPVEILQFNPWLFSGTEQLATSFFHEIAAQLQDAGDKSLQKTGEALTRYGDALSPLSALPIIGKWAERFGGASKFFGPSIESREHSKSRTDQPNGCMKSCAKDVV